MDNNYLIALGMLSLTLIVLALFLLRDRFRWTASEPIVATSKLGHFDVTLLGPAFLPFFVPLGIYSDETYGMLGMICYLLLLLAFSVPSWWVRKKDTLATLRVEGGVLVVNYQGQNYHFGSGNGQIRTFPLSKKDRLRLNGRNYRVQLISAEQTIEFNCYLQRKWANSCQNQPVQSAPMSLLSSWQLQKFLRGVY